MSTFVCPFCGALSSFSESTQRVRNVSFDYQQITRDTAHTPSLSIVFFRCPNERCKKETVWGIGVNGYMSNGTTQIYPQVICRHFPEYVPIAIRNDYEEARAIVNRSPKAAAALARRCLQGMIRDFWGIHARTLNAEITQLKDKVTATQWRAIDAVRSIGNIGAHMEHDVNLIVEIEPGEAEKLLRLIEHLIDKWYIDRREAELLYNEITAIGEHKADVRKNG